MEWIPPRGFGDFLFVKGRKYTARPLLVSLFVLFRKLTFLSLEEGRKVDRLPRLAVRCPPFSDISCVVSGAPANSTVPADDVFVSRTYAVPGGRGKSSSSVSGDHLHVTVCYG